MSEETRRQKLLLRLQVFFPNRSIKFLAGAFAGLSTDALKTVVRAFEGKLND